MDALLSGILGGIFGPPLGSFLSRFRYPTVLALGLISGLLFNVLFMVYELLFGGGMSELSAASSNSGYLNMFVAFIFMPILCALVYSAMRVIAPPPSFEAALVMLENEGYEKHVADSGRRIEYRKDRIMVIFRVDRRYGPPQAEWWRDGKRKGDILLRNPIYDGR